MKRTVKGGCETPAGLGRLGVLKPSAVIASLVAEPEGGTVSSENN